MAIETIKSKKIILTMVMVCIISAIIGYEIYDEKTKKEYVTSIEPIEKVEVVEEKVPNIEVYILGCVNTPGTYEVPKNTTIKKIAEIAGGFTEGADLEKINLVYKVRDNTMIVVKDKNEIQKEESAMQLVKGIYADEKDDDIDFTVNINTATKDKLTELPGIGASVAKRIIKYREDNGDFENVEDLMNVAGIGANKFNGIKDMIVIS